MENDSKMPMTDAGREVVTHVLALEASRVLWEDRARRAERAADSLTVELDIARKFHDVAVKERDAERVARDRIERALQSAADDTLHLQRQLDAMTKSRDEHLAALNKLRSEHSDLEERVVAAEAKHEALLKERSKTALARAVEGAEDELREIREALGGGNEYANHDTTLALAIRAKRAMDDVAALREILPCAPRVSVIALVRDVIGQRDHWRDVCGDARAVLSSVRGELCAPPNVDVINHARQTRAELLAHRDAANKLMEQLNAKTLEAQSTGRGYITNDGDGRSIVVQERYADAFSAVVRELVRIKDTHAKRPFASPHEVYGVLVEEVDEFFEEVRKNDDRAALEELVQIGCVAVRAAAEMMAALASETADDEKGTG